MEWFEVLVGEKVDQRTSFPTPLFLHVGAADIPSLDAGWESIEDDYIPFDPARKRTEAHVKNKGGGKKRDFVVIKVRCPHLAHT